MKKDYQGLVHDSIQKILQNFFMGEEDFVQQYISAADLEEKFDFSFNQKGVNNKDFISLIEQVIRYSPDTQHPGFGARLYAGILPEAFVGQVLSVALNLALGPYHASQIGAVIERKCIEMICEKLGFTNGDGVMTPGGLFANAEAIHLARFRKFPETKHRGMAGVSFHIYVSDQAHYSFEKSAARLGIGTDSIIKIKSDSLGRMCIKDLKREIDQSCTKGITPLMVVSTAGTTVLGAFDSIDEIKIITKEYKIWHHVDLIWGAAVLFSDRMDYIKGIEHVDSVAFNAHKALGTGISTSFILINNQPEILSRANSIGGTEYLNYKTGDDDYFATGNKSQQCGRPNDALSFFFAMKGCGFDGYAQLLDNYFKLSAYFADKVISSNKMKIFTYNNQQPYLNVCLQICDIEGAVDQDLTHKVQEFLIQKNPIWLVEKAVVKNHKVIRFVFINQNLDQQYIDNFFTEFEKIIILLQN